ncbi:MAG: S41 family peptidase [Flavobacteriales bacterium]
MRSKLILFALLISGVFYAFKDPYFEISKNLDIFTSVYQKLNLYYVDELEPGDLMQTAIKSMMESTDPYTNYFPESMVESHRIRQQESLGNIGVEVTKIDNQFVISKLFEASPSIEAGLKVGDAILSIDNLEVDQLTLDDVRYRLEGETTSILTLNVQSFESNKTKTIEVERQTLDKKSVPYASMLDEETGYISLQSFSRGCANDVKTAFENLKEQGMQSLILDLRGNPGGLLRESVNLCNIFIPKGELVVTSKGKTEEHNQAYRCSKTPVDTEMPIVVLVNGGSASASEIVSGTFQDIDRAVVMGEKTFGKGLVQQTLRMPYNAQIKITVAKYYTPSGRCIQAIDYSKYKRDEAAPRQEFKTRSGRSVFDGNGVEPDVLVEPNLPSNLLQNIKKNHHIHRFANRFKAKHDSIVSAEEFQLSDVDYQQFIDELNQADFDYNYALEKELEVFENQSSKSSFSSSLKENIQALKASLEAQKVSEFDQEKEAIKKAIELELIGRYYYKRGQLISALAEDPACIKAKALLKDSEAYEKLLR